MLHNAGVNAQNLKHARVGLSKALNSTARWAPRVVNPVDVNGKGIVYRFDIRDYWGYTLIDTSDPDFALFYGGCDDDLAFAHSKIDLNGKPIKYASLAEMVHRLKPAVTPDEKFARLVWARVLKGNAEGAVEGESLPPNIDGFIGTRKIGPNGQEYVEPDSLSYAEAWQLTYTLTRPDVRRAETASTGRRSMSSPRASPIISAGTSTKPTRSETSPIRSGRIRFRNSLPIRAERRPRT